MIKTNVHKVPEELVSGDRIIFSSIMGGTSEIVTVKSVTFDDNGIAYIRTDEKPFPILSLIDNAIEMAS